MSVYIVLIIKVLVKNMIESAYYKQHHNINYFNLGLKCPLLITHSDYLPHLYNDLILEDTIVFQDTLYLYERDINTIASYFIYKIIKNCLVTKEDINTYESYFFNSLSGFCKLKKNDETLFDPALVGRYWIMLLDIHNKILQLTLQSDVKRVDILSDEIYKPFVHLNISDIKPFSYKISPLIKLTFLNDTITFIDIFPYFNVYTTLYHIALGHEFGKKLNSVLGFYLSMTSPSYSFKNINISSNYKLFTIIYNSCKVDFKIPNIVNCSSCTFRSSCAYLKTNEFKDTPLLYMKKKKVTL